MRRQIHMDRIGLSAMLACLGGFEEIPTPKELRYKRIGRLFAKGLLYKEIAEELGISTNTVCSVCSRHGLRRKSNMPWSKVEIRRLIELRLAGNTYKKIGRILSRRADSCCYQYHYYTSRAYFARAA